ncbi:MAG TPA: urate oxidase [Streptosporangiaceae bacterium]|nr:urate oxidase [Streptosporangiaceae bacterium]
MAVILGPNHYGKAGIRFLRVVREADRASIREFKVSVMLAGDMHGAYVTGDNASVIPTDTQKNTVHAFAARYGITSPEAFGLLLGQHFTTSQPAIHSATVRIEEYRWIRMPAVAASASHSFVREGAETRIAVVRCDQGGAAVVDSGVAGLAVLNAAGSEFRGFAKDEYTTLAETSDRILATLVNGRWRHERRPSPGDNAVDWAVDWDGSYAEVRGHLLNAFTDTHSFSLQHTLYAMGKRVLDCCVDVGSVWLSLPNLHHVVVDLTPFGIANDNELFAVSDQPYGLIEACVGRVGDNKFVTGDDPMGEG